MPFERIKRTCTDRSNGLDSQTGRSGLPYEEVEAACRMKRSKRLVVRTSKMRLVGRTARRGLSGGQLEKTCRSERCERLAVQREGPCLVVRKRWWSFLIRTKRLAVRKQSIGLDGRVARRDLPVGQIDATGQLESRVLSCRSATTRRLVDTTGQSDSSFGPVKQTRRSEKRLVPCHPDRTKGTRRIGSSKHFSFGWAKHLAFGRDPRASPLRQNAREIRSKATTLPCH